MVVYNAGSKELTAKIVYYGPGLGGKTTNLQFLHRRLEPASVGNLLTLAATADRTIFFDLLPVELGELKGYRIRFQVATVPGQSPYNETRRVVLRGADGIVFVVDSRWSMLPKNLESFQNLKDNLKEEGLAFESLPVVVQFNKRDLPDVLAVDALQEGLGLSALPYIEAVASEGKGVVETFKLISKLTFVDILRRLQKKGPPRAVRPSVPLAPAALEIEEEAAQTRAIPVPAVLAPPEESPFTSADDTNPALRLAAPSRQATINSPEAIVAETFTPFPEAPPLREDTNPAFRPYAGTPSSTTASFPAVAAEPPAPLPAESTSPFSLSESPIPEPERPQPVPREVPVRAKEPRNIELAGMLSLLDGRLAKLEETIPERISKIEQTRPWLLDLDDVRNFAANHKLSSEKALEELKASLGKLQRETAEASNREMELVAQNSRASLEAAAALEKLGIRIQETEEKFSQLAIDQESRLSRLERLIEEQASRHTQEQEGQRRALQELRSSLLGAVDALRDALHRAFDAPGPL